MTGITRTVMGYKWQRHGDADPSLPYAAYLIETMVDDGLGDPARSLREVTPDQMARYHLDPAEFDAAVGASAMAAVTELQARVEVLQEQLAAAQDAAAEASDHSLAAQLEAATTELTALREAHRRLEEDVAAKADEARVASMEASAAKAALMQADLPVPTKQEVVASHEEAAQAPIGEGPGMAAKGASEPPEAERE